jgi:hypothetical protein
MSMRRRCSGLPLSILLAGQQCVRNITPMLEVSSRPQRASESIAASASIPVSTLLSNVEGRGLPPERFDTDMRYEHHIQDHDANAIYPPLRTPQMIKESRRLRHELDEQKKSEEERRKSATGKGSTIANEKPRQDARIRKERSERHTSEEQLMDTTDFAKAIGINRPADTRNNIKRWQHELELEPEQALRSSEQGIVETGAQTTNVAKTTTHPNISPVPATTPVPHAGSGQALASRLNGYFSGRNTALSPYSD